MTYESIIHEITVILAGFEFPDEVIILGIPGMILDVMKNTITHFTLFKDPFTGPATYTVQLHIWSQKCLKSISPWDVGMEPMQQLLARVSALFKYLCFWPVSSIGPGYPVAGWDCIRPRVLGLDLQPYKI
jgi:hypothetical protein